MRLPLRHAPPAADAPIRRCAHLAALAEAAVGLPLGPAAALLSGPRSRGRHGNALQWHLGLPAHDGAAGLDWEDRIEIKLVSVWRRGDAVACDKVKVCDLSVDPWRKLSNVLWVVADRLTRVVVGFRITSLTGTLREELSRSWSADPHFDRPDLFVEAREQDDRSAPAYYLSAAFVRRFVLHGSTALPVFPFDARFFGRARQVHGRDPAISLSSGSGGSQRCPRCAGSLQYDAAAVAAEGWAPAHHGMPLGPGCAGRDHLIVDAARLHAVGPQSPAEFVAALEARLPRQQVWRLADRVAEPDDHEHEHEPARAVD